MPINYPAVLAVSSEPRVIEWTDRDAILYALGVGYGADPLDEADLRFVYEAGLHASPAFAAVLTNDFELREPIGMDLALSVHGAHRIDWLRPLAPSGRGCVSSRVTQVIDKGPGKGALIVTETRLVEDGRTEPTIVATLTRFARGDGGCGAPATGGETPHQPPSRAADIRMEAATQPAQALLYRLSGDRNPLHVDPGVALKAGFPRPILHGLCAFGIACRIGLRAYANNDPTLMRSQSARFSSPVYPGETLVFDLWRDGPIISFEAHVKGREVKAMTAGRIELTGE